MIEDLFSKIENEIRGVKEVEVALLLNRDVSDCKITYLLTEDQKERIRKRFLDQREEAEKIQDYLRQLAQHIDNDLKEVKWWNEEERGFLSFVKFLIESLLKAEEYGSKALEVCRYIAACLSCEILENVSLRTGIAVRRIKEIDNHCEKCQQRENCDGICLQAEELITENIQEELEKEKEYPEVIKEIENKSGLFGKEEGLKGSAVHIPMKLDDDITLAVIALRIFPFQEESNLQNIFKLARELIHKSRDELIRFLITRTENMLTRQVAPAVGVSIRMAGRLKEHIAEVRKEPLCEFAKKEKRGRWWRNLHEDFSRLRSLLDIVHALVDSGFGNTHELLWYYCETTRRPSGLENWEKTMELREFSFNDYRVKAPESLRLLFEISEMEGWEAKLDRDNLKLILTSPKGAELQGDNVILQSPTQRESRLPRLIPYFHPDCEKRENEGKRLEFCIRVEKITPINPPFQKKPIYERIEEYNEMVKALPSFSHGVSEESAKGELRRFLTEQETYWTLLDLSDYDRQMMMNNLQKAREILKSRIGYKTSKELVKEVKELANEINNKKNNVVVKVDGPSRYEKKAIFPKTGNGMIDLKSVIELLIQNAIEHSGVEEVEITVTVREEEEQIILEIIDNGKGFPEEIKVKEGGGLSQALLFVEESHGSMKLSSRQGGAKIEYDKVQQILKEGKIKLSDEYRGDRTTISITLPCIKAKLEP